MYIVYIDYRPCHSAVSIYDFIFHYYIAFLNNMFGFPSAYTILCTCILYCKIFEVIRSSIHKLQLAMSNILDYLRIQIEALYLIIT